MTEPTNDTNLHTLTNHYLSDLKTEPDNFQFRAYETDEKHVQDLVSAIRAGNDLDPMTVWKRGLSDYVIINGHHRFEAYQRCELKSPVPVHVHECCEADAKLLALSENAKTKLPMTNTEKSDAAWRLVFSEHEYSKSQISAATGVSDGTIAKMRRHLKKMIEEELDIPFSWWAAMRVVKGVDSDEWDEERKELMIEATARVLDDLIGKDLGRIGRRYPEAVAIVLAERLTKQTLGYVFDELGLEPENLDDLPF